MLSLWIFFQLTLIGILQDTDAIYDGPEQSSPEIGELPYMVEIFDTILAERTGSCGGAIIDPTHILTAAHCCAGSLEHKLTIIAGVVDLFSDCRVVHEGVAKIFVHKKFAINGTLWHRTQNRRWSQLQKWFRDTWKHFKYGANYQLAENDIAVLKLKEALPIGHNIQPVNLPSLHFLPHYQYCIFAGWGQTEINGPASRHLYATRLVILPPEECRASGLRLPSNEFCAIDPSYRSMSLDGDSGAPLVLDNTVYGVASRGTNSLCNPSTFTKVSAHLKFIREVLEK